MKISNFLFLILLLFVMSLLTGSLAAQTTPLHLGKVEDFHHNFQNRIIRKGKEFNTVSIHTSAHETLKIKLKINKKKRGVHEISGEVVNEENSTFYVTGTSSDLKGFIILKNKRKAYKYYSDAKGEAYLKPEDINKIICINYDKPSAAIQKESVVNSSAAIPIYQSLPGAQAVVLLDFDGQYVVSPAWNQGNPINALPYSATAEEIREIWELISEDYRPFVLNITTDESVYFAAPANRRMRCIFTPTTVAAPNSGGVAYASSFTWGNETPCWVFNAGVKYGGEAGSHEIGHTVGLAHDGRTNPSEEYYAGTGGWAPIMGVAYYQAVGQFSMGEYNNANNLQDDISIISSNNGFTFRPDQYGNTNATATTLTPGANNTVSISGIIEQRTDKDVFVFHTSGGNVNLTISPGISFPAVNVYPDLNISATLRNSSNTVIAASDPAGIAAAAFNINLAAGTYYITIDGVGEGDPATTGYSDYASLGSYTISGTLPPALTLRNADNPANALNGLDYKYLQGTWSTLPDFASMAPVKTGMVTSFDLSPRTQNDNFGFRYTGYVDVPTDGVYTFYTSSDDGSKLYIGSTLIVNNDGYHPVLEKSGIIALKAGKHAIAVDFFEATGDESLSVSYAGPGIGKTVIPASALYRVSSVALRNADNPANTGNGLDYKYFQGAWSSLPDFGSVTPVKTGTVTNFDISPRTQNDNFGFRYTGYVNVPADGVYTFYTSSDDGSKLYIGSALIVNNDGLHGVVEKSGTIGLRAGKHALTVDFFEAGGGESISVSYQGPGIGKTTIPASALYRVSPTFLRDPENPAITENGLDYKYYQGTWSALPDFASLTPTKTGTVTGLDFSPRLQSQNFGFRYTGYVQVYFDGTYTFYTGSDDGSKLYIGNSLIVNNDGLHALVEKSGTIGLKAGKHAITVEYFQQGGADTLVVSYEHPAFGRAVIPSALLYRIPIASRKTDIVLDLETKFSSEEMTIYPNPAIDKATLKFFSKEDQIIGIDLFDIAGKKILHIKQHVNSGTNDIPLLLEEVVQGVYIVNVTEAEKQTQIKIVIYK